jgi:ribonuclease P protein component
MQTFKKEERLCKKKTIKILFEEGKKFHVYPFKIIWLDVESDSKYPARILISVSKRFFKKAVDRNKIRRQIREVYRKNKSLFYEYLSRQKKHCVFAILYTDGEFIPFIELEKKIIIILQRLIDEHEKTFK